MNNKFDKKAKYINDHPVMQGTAYKFAELLKSKVPLTEESRLMDFGCGSGLVGIHLHEDVESIVMLDSSEGMLDVLRGRMDKSGITNMNILNCDICDIPAEFKNLDVIYLNKVLHHIDDITNFFEQVYLLLKPGGYLCVGDLRKEDGTFHKDNTDVKHFGFEEKELHQILSEKGFSDIYFDELDVVEKPNSFCVMRKFPMFFMRAVKA